MGRSAAADAPADELTVEAARRLVMQHAAPTPTVRVPLAQAHGRSLAEPVSAADPLPLFDNSSVDGYALQSEASSGAQPSAPIHLRITGTSRAGAEEIPRVGTGEAVRVLTGAPVPPGADAVVRQEDVRLAGETWIELRRPVPAGEAIRRRGEEIAAGDEACEAGMVVTPPVLGLLSALGVSHAPVHRPVRVALLLTGDELADPGEALRPGQIRDSNTFSLRAAIVDCGAELVLQRRLRDDPESVRTGLSEALEAAEVVAVSGGVSVGDHDYVKGAAGTLGVRRVFWGVRQRPGFPLYFGHRSGQAFFGLPGNPVSSLVCFYEYVWPFLRRSMGYAHAGLRSVRARLADPVVKTKGKTHFLRGRIEFRADTDPTVILGSGQGSHMLQSFGEADCLAVIPETVDRLEPGASVRCHLLPWFAAA